MIVSLETTWLSLSRTYLNRLSSTHKSTDNLNETRTRLSPIELPYSTAVYTPLSWTVSLSGTHFTRDNDL